LGEFEISVETEDIWKVELFLDESQIYWIQVTNASPKNYSIWLEVMLDCKKSNSLIHLNFFHKIMFVGKSFKSILVKRDEFGNTSLIERKFKLILKVSLCLASLLTRAGSRRVQRVPKTQAPKALPL
jgi:hypothetical protein